MSGRGDNNKKGSSGRGSSNQSNQAFGSSEQKGKSNHGEQTGGRAQKNSQKNKIRPLTETRVLVRKNSGQVYNTKSFYQNGFVF